jgi:hypothetical protein
MFSMMSACAQVYVYLAKNPMRNKKEYILYANKNNTNSYLVGIDRKDCGEV